MSVRALDGGDAELVRELWEEAAAATPSPDWLPRPGFAETWAAITAASSSGAAALALDDDGAAVGLAWAPTPLLGRARLELLYVRPSARRRGHGSALLAECVAQLAARGATSVSLEAPDSSPAARAVWHRLGFAEQAELMGAPLDGLRAKLAAPRGGPSHGLVHVRSADLAAIERAVAQFTPRLESATVEAGPGGWLRIADPLLDADRDAQGRLAGDISDRLGAVSAALAVEEGAVVRLRLWDRGQMIDEYLSVPTYYGELPKVDELALAANPSAIARLTGAPFEEVRQLARTAASTAELPPAEELYAALARLLGLEP